MEINNLCKTSYPVYYAKAQKQTCAGSVCQPQNIDVSLYNSKGVRIPFCGLVKGADFIEENCINFLRKIRENRCRKFDEYDIKEMLETLRKEKNSSDRESVLKEVFCIESEDFGKTPPKDFLKRALRLTAGRPEDERFAILEFAQHELNNATKPLEAFAALPVEKQDKLVKILKDINKIDDATFSTMDEPPYQNIDSVYDFFRVLVYAEDDLAKLSKAEANTYKVDTYHLIKDDLEFFKKQNYPNENIKKKVNTVTQNIYNYFMENIL